MEIIINENYIDDDIITKEENNDITRVVNIENGNIRQFDNITKKNYIHDQSKYYQTKQLEYGVTTYSTPS